MQEQEKCLRASQQKGKDKQKGRKKHLLLFAIFTGQMELEQRGQIAKPKHKQIIQGASYITGVRQVRIHLLAHLGDESSILYLNAIKLFTTQSGGFVFITVKYKAKCPFFRSTKD